MAGLKIFVLFCFLVSLNCELKAQSNESISVEGHIFAEIVTVFSAVETAQLNFGRFTPGPQGGQIVITPQSSVSVLGSVFPAIGTHNAGCFYVSGDLDAAFTITLPDQPVVLKHNSSGRSMIIEDWVSTPNQGVGAGILQNGEKLVYIGATLKVGTLQDNPVGVYAGTYSITFDFN